MKNRRVFAFKNLPTKFPIFQGVLFWLLLDRLKAPGWVWGAAGCLYSVLVGSCIVAMANEVKVDVFELQKKPNS